MTLILHPLMRRLASVLLVVSLAGFVFALSGAGCASVNTGISPVADIANAGGKIEDSGQAIFQAPIQSTVPQAAKDAVAIAVNKLGHVGLTLNAALTAYNQVKAAGGDLTAQRAAVQQALATVSQFLIDIGTALPTGTLQAVDTIVTTIVTTVAQVKLGVGL